ncbi:MAG: hypoxanthine phosphoribosyltransferase, partial [Firmicutes bacterium]|nr:hypoxanthine phosphoribosyltransferase [Bacillota bacterium]
MTAEKRDVSTVLISEEQIAAKVREIGEKIGRDYAGEAVLLVGILKGSVAFLADLMRAIPLEDVSIDF